MTSQRELYHNRRRLIGTARYATLMRRAPSIREDKWQEPLTRPWLRQAESRAKRAEANLPSTNFGYDRSCSDWVAHFVGDNFGGLMLYLLFLFLVWRADTIASSVLFLKQIQTWANDNTSLVRIVSSLRGLHNWAANLCLVGRLTGWLTGWTSADVGSIVVAAVLVGIVWGLFHSEMGLFTRRVIIVAFLAIQIAFLLGFVGGWAEVGLNILTIVVLLAMFCVIFLDSALWQEFGPWLVHPTRFALFSLFAVQVSIWIGWIPGWDNLTIGTLLLASLMGLISVKLDALLEQVLSPSIWTIGLAILLFVLRLVGAVWRLAFAYYAFSRTPEIQRYFVFLNEPATFVLAVWASKNSRVFIAMTIAIAFIHPIRRGVCYLRDNAVDILNRVTNAIWWTPLSLYVRRGLRDYENGRLMRALLQFDWMSSTLKESGATIGMAMSYYVIGRVREEQKEFSSALDHYQQALSILQRTEDVQEQAGVLYSIGNIYGALGDLEKAKENYEESRKLAESVGDNDSIARALSGIGNIMQIQGDLRKALDCYQKATRLTFARAVDLRALASNLGDVGVVYRLLGDTFRSWWYSGFAGLVARLSRAREEVIRSHYNIGKIHWSWGRIDKAYAEFERGISVIEATRKALIHEESRSTVLETYGYVYEAMVQTCLALAESELTQVHTYYTEKAFEYIERAKSRAFLELLGVHPVLPWDQLPDELVNQFRELSADIDQLYGQLEALCEESMSRPEVQTFVQTTIEEFELKELDIWRKIRERIADVQAPSEVARLKQIQTQLPQGTALVEYFSTADEMIVFIITRHDLQWKRVYFSRTALWDLLFEVGKLQDELDCRLTTVQSLKSLYDQIFAPIREILDATGIRSICFVPHGLLHLVPLHAMWRWRNGELCYLIEEFSVAYAPSASVLKHCLSRNPRKNDSFLGIANPDGSLYYAKPEVETIAALYPRHCTIIGGEAKIDVVRQQSEQYDVVHFACHGLFHGNRPQRSCLKLADGLMTVVQIMMDLRLQAYLVTLSACETGVSEIEGGDEVVGLTRAFISAGASSVVASLWKVDDQSTGKLMEKFYEGLHGGEDKATALREAQVWLMRQPQYSHPYFWAPFILVGDWR